MALWVPPAVSRQLQDRTNEYRAELREHMSFQSPVCAQWSAELQKIDPYLRLAKAHEGARVMGVLPGFYHLVRLNPDAPPWVMPLRGPDGGFVEPTSAMLDMLRASDMQNARVMADREQAQRRARESAERDEQRRDRERQEDMLERFRSLENASISVGRDL